MRRLALAVFLLAACDKGGPPPGETTATATPTAASTASSSSTSIATAAPTPTAPPSATSTATAGTPDAIIAQHILVIYKGAKRAPKTITRSKAEAKARAQEALAKVRSGTLFADVVKEYSDDTGSAERMGSVGKFHRDDMDPAFSSAAFALAVNEVSDVVETPFGFHVIKRTF